MGSTTPQQDEPVEPNPTPTEETNTGLDENVAAALAYVLGWLSGIIMYFIESDNDRVRFHAAQSTVVFGAIFVFSWILGFVQSALFGGLSAIGTGGRFAFGLLSMLFGFVSLVLWVVAFVLWAYLLVRTYQGEDVRIPVAAGVADDIA